MNNINEKLIEAFGKVLEDLAFMFTEPSVDEDLELSGEEPYLVASMGFSGSVDGTIRIGVPETMAPELAINMLGTSDGEAITDEMAIDSLKELLNVTCGRVVTNLVGREVIMELTIPEVDETTARSLEQGGRETVKVQVDDDVVFLTLLLER